jgi:hypothetical protein
MDVLRWIFVCWGSCHVVFRERSHPTSCQSHSFSFDKKKSLQLLPKVTWRTKSPVVKNNWDKFRWQVL